MSSPAPVVIVTGASRGIGAAITTYLLTHTPARLFLVSRTAAPLVAFKNAYPSRVDFLAVDISTPSAATTIVHQTVKTFDRVDTLIINHGVLDPIARLEHADPALWAQGFSINLFAPVALIQAAIPLLRTTHGRVVMVSSGAAVVYYPAWGAYGAAKAAMNHLVATLAVEEPHITAVAVRPGIVDTAMQTRIRGEAETMGSLNEKFQELFREGKLLKPEVPGNVIARLGLGGRKELSGKFLSWDGEELREYRE